MTVKSKLDSTVWYKDQDVYGSLRELLEMSKSFSSITKLRISDLISKTLPLELNTTKKTIARIENADVSCPITVITKNNKIHRIADGHHRVHSAIRKRMSYIPALVIPIEKLSFPFSEIFKESRIEEWKQAMTDQSEKTHEAN